MERAFPLLSPRLRALCFFVLFAAIAIPECFAQRVPVNESDALAVFDLPKQQARLVKDRGAAYFVLPKDPATGQVVESVWGYVELQDFREYKCNNPDDAPFSNLSSSIKARRGCDETDFFRFDTMDPSHFEVEHLGEDAVRVNWTGLGVPGATMSMTIEGIQFAETRQMTNKFNISKQINVRESTVKTTLEIKNYTSQVLKPEDQVFNGTHGYFTSFEIRLEMEVSTFIVPVQYFMRSDPYLLPVWPNITASTPDQILFEIKTIDPSFRVELYQAAFSVNDPPALTSGENSGFEAVSADMYGWNLLDPTPNRTKFWLDWNLLGGTDVLYDPDVSILLTGDGGDEDQSSGESKDDDAVIIAVAVVVPVVVVGVVVIAAVSTLWMKLRSRRNKQHLQESLNKAADESA
ncbi:Transmembrane protein [Balamuthia mandrillaris]